MGKLILICFIISIIVSGCNRTSGDNTERTFKVVNGIYEVYIKTDLTDFFDLPGDVEFFCDPLKYGFEYIGESEATQLFDVPDGSVVVLLRQKCDYVAVPGGLNIVPDFIFLDSIEFLDQDESTIEYIGTDADGNPISCWVASSNTGSLTGNGVELLGPPDDSYIFVTSTGGVMAITSNGDSFQKVRIHADLNIEIDWDPVLY